MGFPSTGDCKRKHKDMNNALTTGYLKATRKKPKNNNTIRVAIQFFISLTGLSSVEQPGSF